MKTLFENNLSLELHSHNSTKMRIYDTQTIDQREVEHIQDGITNSEIKQIDNIKAKLDVAYESGDFTLIDTMEIELDALYDNIEFRLQQRESDLEFMGSEDDIEDVDGIHDNWYGSVSVEEALYDTVSRILLNTTPQASSLREIANNPYNYTYVEEVLTENRLARMLWDAMTDVTMGTVSSNPNTKIKNFEDLDPADIVAAGDDAFISRSNYINTYKNIRGV